MIHLQQPASLWRETALPAPPANELSATIEADLAIVGGGFTGLAAALRAIELGLETVVFEAAEVGFGASGRNGGVVSTKFRASLSRIAKHHGVDVAQRMYRLGLDAMDCVEGNVQTYAIRDAGFLQTGNLSARPRKG